MVNVAGRSKGCSTCRKRRVKCDETCPICKRCQRGGLECDGPKGTTFVQGTIVASRRSEKRVNPSTKGYGIVAKDSVDGQIPDSLSLSGYELDVYLCFTLKRLRGGPVDLALHGAQRNDVIAAGHSATNGQIFHQTILSFAAIYFGIQHRQSSVTNQGYAILGTSLIRLNQALSNTKNHASEDVLLSVITLALLESFVPSSPKQYLNHMLALEKLLELHVPSSLPPGLVRGVRYMLLFASLRIKRPSILAKDEWKQALRQNCSPTEIEEQDLFDVMADCTVLLATCEHDTMTVQHNECENFSEQKKLEQTAMALLYYLHAWRLRWNGNEKNIHVEISSAELRHWSVNEFTKMLYASEPTIFKFANPLSATMFMLYNTTLIWVLRVLNLLSCQFPRIQLIQSLTNNPSIVPADLEDTTQSKEHYWSSVERSAALDAVRCIPYLANQSRLDLRVVNLAITTIWTTINNHDSVECAWMRDIVESQGQGLIARGLRPDNNGSNRSKQFGQHRKVTEMENT